MNTTHPDQMPPDQRLREVATILATGFLRYIKKQKTENIHVDKLPDQWPYGRKSTKGEKT
ncbi:MAG: hypothetical protein HQL95_00865 [Magnetococcales bacterium]|nr:hypothetical protein [Magnetococcales bacterium]